MEKSVKVFWSYVLADLIFAEIGIDFFLHKCPYHTTAVRAAFVILNVLIAGYLLYLRDKARKLNLKDA